MIKINLLPQKRPKHKAAVGRRGPPSTADSGSKHMLFGVFALLGVGLAVFFVFDMPARAAIVDYKTKTAQLQTEINQKATKLIGYDKQMQAETDAVKKIQSIDRLVKNKIVPANILHELGYILHSRGPTMTDRMRDAQKSDTNKQFQEGWDPTHVWLSSFSDTNGIFKLEGGANSKDDVTQLSKRLAASVYFTDVSLLNGDRVTDRDRGINYFKFTITGKVAY